MAGVNQVSINPGPIDDRILYQQNSHVSKYIWENRTEVNLRVHNHNITRDLDPPVLSYVHRAGFYGLFQLGFLRVDNALITALVDRWRPETHTFHFLPGECTITLQDIEVLGGICVDGDPIIRSEQGDTKEARIDRIELLLGRRPDDSDVDEGGACVKIAWLHTHFTELPPDSDDFTVRCFARAAILLLLGAQFLSDKSGTYVSVVYLPFLEDFDSCKQLSWGSAILACLYRNLCKTSLKLVNGFAGAACLLQLWAWTRLTQTRPRDVVPNEVVVPAGYVRYTFGYRWATHVGRRAPDIVAHNLRHYRDHFDQMLPSQIVWEPYLPCMEGLPDYSTAGRNIWRARVPLICMEIVEFHQPDRVLRQFGMRQPIPQPSMHDERAHRMSRKGRTRADWVSLHAGNLALWNERANHIISDVLHGGNTSVTDDYMDWYLRVTRRLIWPPDIVPPERGFRANAGRMEIMEDLLFHSYREFERLHSDENVRYLQEGFSRLQMDPAQAHRDRQARRDSQARRQSEPRRQSQPRRDRQARQDDITEDEGHDDIPEDEGRDVYDDFGGDIAGPSQDNEDLAYDDGSWGRPLKITSHRRRPRDDEPPAPRTQRQREESSSRGGRSDSGPTSKGNRRPLSSFYSR